MSKEVIHDFIYIVTSFIVVFIICILYSIFIEKKESNTYIEKNINDIEKKNDSIKITINNLDSIKNAEIIEISTLDSDSTIKLFYKLLKE